MVGKLIEEALRESEKVAWNCHYVRYNLMVLLSPEKFSIKSTQDRKVFSGLNDTDPYRPWRIFQEVAP